MRKCSSCGEVLANEHDTCSKCGTINIGVGDSADSDQESQSGSVARSQKFRFSIRGMLIAVAAIAIGAAGYQFWVQSTTEYELQGTISYASQDFYRINAKSGAASWPKRFNYYDSDAGKTEFNGYVTGFPVIGDESIMCWIGIGSITYKTTANYYNKAKKIADLRSQLKKTERREINSDLHFHKIWIGEGQSGGSIKLIKEIPLDKAK